MRTNDRGVGLAMVQIGTRALDEEEIESLDDAVIHADLVTLWQAMCRLQAQFSLRVAVCRRRGGRSTISAAWLRRRLRVDPAEAARHVTVASTMHTLPSTEDAFRRGDISFVHVHAICQAARDLGAEVMASGGEEALLSHARRDSPNRVSSVARQIQNRLRAAGRDT
jgi:Domain of unknown function (DUF222)